MPDLIVSNQQVAEVELLTQSVEVEQPTWRAEAKPPTVASTASAPNRVAGVSPTVAALDVLLIPGPKGPQGLAGQMGPAGTFEELFTFASPSTLWTLPQTSGRRFIDVQTFDINDQEIFGDVTYFDGYVEVRWFHPTAGSARVSM